MQLINKKTFLSYGRRQEKFLLTFAVHTQSEGLRYIVQTDGFGAFSRRTLATPIYGTFASPKNSTFVRRKIATPICFLFFWRTFFGVFRLSGVSSFYQGKFMVVLKDKEEEEVVDKVAEMVAEHHFFADWSP